jgi:hypothetical protein
MQGASYGREGGTFWARLGRTVLRAGLPERAAREHFRRPHSRASGHGRGFRLAVGGVRMLVARAVLVYVRVMNSRRFMSDMEFFLNRPTRATATWAAARTVRLPLTQPNTERAARPWGRPESF